MGNWKRKRNEKKRSCQDSYRTCFGIGYNTKLVTVYGPTLSVKYQYGSEQSRKNYIIIETRNSNIKLCDLCILLLFENIISHYLGDGSDTNGEDDRSKHRPLWNTRCAERLPVLGHQSIVISE